jgi:hypothetical protein
MRRLACHRIRSRTVGFASIAVLLVTHLSLMGFEQLHLHLDYQGEIIHQHLHAGHHEHDDHHDEKPAERKHDDSGDRGRSIVVSFAHGAFVHPAPMPIQAIATRTGRFRVSTAVEIPRIADVHPSRNPRAPPA